MHRGEVWREVKSLVTNWNSSLPNVVDMLVSSLYQDSIQVITQPGKISIVNKLKWQARYAIDIFQSFFQDKIWGKKDSIIFWAVEHNHVNQMLPLVRHFKAEGTSYFWVTSKLKIANRLKSIGEAYCYIPPFYGISHSAVKALRNTGRKYVKSMSVESPLQAIWLRNIERNTSHVVSLMKTNMEIIDRFNPRAVVIGNDLTVEGRVAANVFKKSGIFTCALQHGDMSSVLHEVHVVDEFFVYGNASLGQVASANSNTRFTVTGSPFLDEFRRSANRSDLSIRETLKLQHQKPYILVAFSGAGDNTSFPHHLELIRSIFKLEESVLDIDIIIKLHPKDKVAFYDQVKQEYPSSEIKIVAYGAKDLPVSIFEWLQGAALLITGASTTAVEAMALEKPVVSVDLIGEYISVGFIEAGTSVHVRSTEELVKSVKCLLSDKAMFQDVLDKARVYAQRYFFHSQLSACHLIAEIITDMINRKTAIKQA